MSSIRELLAESAELSSDSARLDAELLLATIMGESRAYLYTWPEREISNDHASVYRDLMARRRDGEPVAYLIGSREFWSLPLKVTRGTLIPRPDTELLVEWALELDLPDTARVCDLGTGGGAIALALASEKAQWRVTAVDVSIEAIKLTRENVRSLSLDNVHAVKSHWFEQVASPGFHLVVSNPPYVAPGDPHLEQGDVRYEPRGALVAENNGLADLTTIVESAAAYLEPGGWLLLEHGAEQAGEVRSLLHNAGYQCIATRTDLAGLPRVTGGCKTETPDG